MTLSAALLLAYANGSNDSFKATATVYGSGLLHYRAALLLATGAQLCGSLASLLLAKALLGAFSGKGLVPPAVVGDPHFLPAVALGAAGTVLVATRFGLPVSTTHALLGGLVGGGLLLAPADVDASILAGRYVVPLVGTPVLATLGAAAAWPLARGILHRSREARWPDALHGVSAFAVGFARGLNDTPKVLALLVTAGWAGVSSGGAFAAVALTMAAGGVLHSARLATTLGHRITTLDRGQGLVANGITSGLVIAASLLGAPVSTTHVSTGAIAGIGLSRGQANGPMLARIVGAWVITLPLGAALAAGAAALLQAP